MAEILPLDGKYYGTKVISKFGTVTVWLEDWNNPKISMRESENGWTENYGWDHVEHKISYSVAQELVKYLNKLEKDYGV